MLRVILDENSADKIQNVRRESDGTFLERSILEGAKILRVRLNDNGALVLKLELRKELREAIYDE